MKNKIKEILSFKENADYKKLSIDEIVILENYIINLQEENERLKEIINDDMTTYLKGLEDGKDKMKECYDSVYKSRNEKAIEYIKNHKETRKHYEPYGTPMGNPNYITTHIFGYYELLNILNGGDE